MDMKEFNRTLNKLTLHHVRFAYVHHWLQYFIKDAKEHPLTSILLVDEIERIHNLFKGNEPIQQYYGIRAHHSEDEIMYEPFQVEQAELARMSLRPLKQKEIAKELGCSVSHVARLQAAGIIPKGATMGEVQGYLVELTRRDPINNIETVDSILQRMKNKIHSQK